MKSKQFYDYTVYEDGTIQTKTGRILYPRIHKNRYEIRITINGQRKNYLLHRLLYWLFVQQFDYDNKNLCVSYKDDNPLNIKLNNLILVDRKELIQGEKHKSIVKLSDKDIEDIKQMYKGNKINSNQYTKIGLSLNDIAKMYGVTKKEIHHVIKGTARNPDEYKLK